MEYLYFIKIHFFFTDKTVLKIGITENFLQRMRNFLYGGEQKYVSHIEPIRVFEGKYEVMAEMEKFIIKKYAISSKFNHLYKNKDSFLYKNLMIMMPDGKSELIFNSKQNIDGVLNDTKHLRVNDFKSDIKQLMFNFQNTVIDDNIEQEKTLRYANEKINELLSDFTTLSKDNKLKKELYASLIKSNEFFGFKLGKGKDGKQVSKRVHRKYFRAEINGEIRLYFLIKYSKNFYTINRVDYKGADAFDNIQKGLADEILKQLRKNPDI